MDKPALTEPRDCWLCFNPENNTKLTIRNSENILKMCRSNLDICINTESFEDETQVLQVSFCNYCYESSVVLTSLENQVEKLRMEISDLSLIFSKNILQRRNRFEKEKDDSVKKSTQSTDNCFSIHKSIDVNFIDGVEIFHVKKEVIESTSKMLSSETQELAGNDNLATDLRFSSDVRQNIDNDKNEIFLHSEDEIEVKYSYDETISKVLCPDNNQIASNRQISTTNAEYYLENTQDNQQKLKISITDLHRCLKMPIIQLERLKSHKTRNSPKIVADNTSSTANFESNDADNCSSSMDNKSSDVTSKIPVDVPIYNLLYEMTQTTVERKFKCSFCSQSFEKASRLKLHEMIHTGERPHKCSVCPKSFKCAAKLNLHTKIHTGERPYKCSLCPKSFICGKHLKVHIKVHTGERPFKCSFCTKWYRYAGDLKVHEMIHTEENPYTCSLCKKSFSNAVVLKRHERMHTEVRPFKCSNCELAFKRKDYLKTHRERIHKNVTEEFILP